MTRPCNAWLSCEISRRPGRSAARGYRRLLHVVSATRAVGGVSKPYRGSSFGDVVRLRGRGSCTDLHEKGNRTGNDSAHSNALSRFVIIPYGEEVTERWAQMAAVLEGRLKGRGVNDMWTAACALSYDLPIVTNNLSDFQTIQAEFSTLTLVHPDL